MPLDAICLRALTNELKGQLLGARGLLHLVDARADELRSQLV